MRRAQMRNCSIAAARKVSPAASRTVLPFGPELGGELADGRRLAGAVDADDEDHERALRRIDHQRAGDRSERALDLVREDPLHLVRIDPALVAPAADRLANAGRGGEAEVGLDEHVLEIVERGGVELALGEDVGRRRARWSSTSARGPTRRR